MLIWRVQCEHGLGPYQYHCGHLTNLIGLPGYSTPSPYSDFGPDIFEYLNRNWYFACPSLEASIAWFGIDMIARLHEENYALMAFEVPDTDVWVSNSGRQCVFRQSPEVKFMTLVKKALVNKSRSITLTRLSDDRVLAVSGLRRAYFKWTGLKLVAMLMPSGFTHEELCEMDRMMKQG
jgi:hypothetical protein